MMEQNKLRKCIPLKIAAHIVMFIAYMVVICCVILFLVSMDNGGRRLTSFLETEVAENEYFSSNRFRNRYGSTLDSLYQGLNLVENGEDDGYPLSTYVDSGKNFQYAVYDTEGQMKYQSDDWDANVMFGGDPKYYYTVDLGEFRLFDVNSIRRTGFVIGENNKAFGSDRPDTALGENTEESYDTETEAEESKEAVETEALDEERKNVEETSVSDTVTDPGEESEGGDTNHGIVEYGSNFTDYTWFYSFDETTLAKKIGYICTYVPGQLEPGDDFYNDYVKFKQWIRWGKLSVVVGIMAFVVMMICLVYLVISAGYSSKYEGVHLKLFDRLYTEVSAAAVLLIVGLSCVFAMDWLELSAQLINFGLLMALAYAAGVWGILSFAKRIKTHTLIKNALVYKIGYGAYDVIYNGYINSHLLRKYIAVIFGFGIADFVLMFTMFKFVNLLWCLFVLIIYAYEFIYVGRKLLNIQEIKKGAQKIASGELEYKIDTSQMSGVFKEFAEDINNIGNGLNAAVDKSIRSERMKTDLITNVSHDIKTPLTSIINYVDLLKRENITEEPIREYIEVLDMKSQRLKALTEDLVEASRASSGNIHLEKHHINFVELVSQIYGTYQEKFESKGLKAVIRNEQPEIMIYADGRRIYRVLDNLFNNAYKYSMEASRVYIDMYIQENKALFVMKNISCAPLNISPEELTQRFVRGDESRTTEGSGLGLSIARSLTELHGGTFEIYLDGDLFKVTLTFDIAAQM